MMLDYRENSQKCHEYVKALEEEKRKIEMFQRELPLCLHLVTQAIETCKQQLSSASTTAATTTTDCINGQSECSEQTTSHGPVFEEFIPIKRSSCLNPQQREHEEEDEHESHNNSTQFSNKNDTPKNTSSAMKSDWLRSVQLWNQSSEPTTTCIPTNQENNGSNQAKKVGAVELKRNGGAFQPFTKGKAIDDKDQVAVSCNKVTTTTPTAHQAASVCSTATEAEGEGGPGKTKDGGSKKSRRCWSPELHRRFLNALQQLGGSQVATPKQIKELMKVDGLTNDEVKSHLQKYRLHNRRPTQSVHSNTNTQAPQLFVVGGIWVPPPEYAKSNAGPTGIYAPVATPPTAVSVQAEREQRNQSSQSRSHNEGVGGARCNSPATSSSTHTTTTSPAY